MNRPEVYQKSVDILYQAYFNDTLEHQNCRACAVGNLVAGNIGVKLGNAPCWFISRVMPLEWVSEDRNSDTGLWYKAINDGSVIKNLLSEDVLWQMNQTGYTPQELAKIENRFERARRGDSEEDMMFYGLCNVLEALKEIHEITDEELTSSNEAKFRNHYATLIK